MSTQTRQNISGNRVIPMKGNIIILPDPDKDYSETKSGLIVQKSVKETLGSMHWGSVVEVSEKGCYEDLKPGNRVCFPRDKGEVFYIGGVRHLGISEKDIICVIL